MSTALLLAEPEPGVRGFLERHLADDGFEVVLDLEEGRRVDLALAPTAELCGRIDAPVIVLGAPESDAVDRVRAFASGADDFLARPFHYEELVARIHAVLRRTARRPHERLQAGPIRIDLPARRVTLDGEQVVLSGKEFELLVALAADPERVFTKEELLRDVWDFRSIGHTRTIDSHASRLRRKLQARGGGPFVVNEWGIGYRLLEL